MAEFMTVTLAANETETFRKGGAYIEVIESAFPVDIAFSDSNGGSTSAIKGAGSLRIRNRQLALLQLI